MNLRHSPIVKAPKEPVPFLFIDAWGVGAADAKFYWDDWFAQRTTAEDFQGVEWPANSLVGELWHLTIYADPGRNDEVSAPLDSAYNRSTLLSAHIKQSVQQSKSSG